MNFKMKYFNIAVIFVLLIIPGFLEAQQNSNNIDIQIDVSEPSAADSTGYDVFETDSLNFKPLSLNEVIQIALLHNRILERKPFIRKNSKNKFRAGTIPLPSFGKFFWQQW